MNLYGRNQSGQRVGLACAARRRVGFNYVALNNGIRQMLILFFDETIKTFAFSGVSLNNAMEIGSRKVPFRRFHN